MRKINKYDFITIIFTLCVAVGCEVRWRRTNTGSRVDTVRVAVHDTVTVEAPQMIVERFIPTEKVLERTDTVFIVEDYQMQRIYADTVRFEYGKVTIIDTVYQNNLVGQQVYTDFEFSAKKEKNHALGVGAAVSSARGTAVNLHFRQRKWTFEAGYDVLNKAPMVGVKYDIIKW